MFLILVAEVAILALLTFTRPRWFKRLFRMEQR